MKQSITATAKERDRIDARENELFARAHPDNVFVAVIGNLWEDGCEKAVDEMVKHTRTEVECWMDSVRPYGFPAVDHCSMRDLAVMMAKTQGFEWVFLLDTDIKVKPDTILNLIDNKVSIVAPYYVDPNNGEMIGDKDLEPDTGLYPVRWITSSATLYRTSVFNCPETKMQGCWLEHEYWIKFWNYGHFPYVDTNTQVDLLRPPSSSGDLNFRDRMHVIEQNYEQSKANQLK